MKDETKKRKLAELLGIEVPKEPTKEERQASEDASFEQQAVIFFLENPLAFKKRVCLQCEREFMVNRRFVAVCSERCTINYLAERGLSYDTTREPNERWLRVRVVGMNKQGEYIVEETPQTRWDYLGGEPMIIGPDVLEILPKELHQENLELLVNDPPLQEQPAQELVQSDIPQPELNVLPERPVESDPQTSLDSSPAPLDVDEYIRGLTGGLL